MKTVINYTIQFFDKRIIRSRIIKDYPSIDSAEMHAMKEVISQHPFGLQPIKEIFISVSEYPWGILNCVHHKKWPVVSVKDKTVVVRLNYQKEYDKILEMKIPEALRDSLIEELEEARSQALVLIKNN